MTKKRTFFWPFALMVCLFYASGQSSLGTPSLNFILPIDKVGHFLIFGLLATLVMRIPKIYLLRWRGALASALIVIAYGAVDEWRQSFTPERTAEPYDLIADALGASTAVLAYNVWPMYRKCLEWSPCNRFRSDSQVST
ncbi:MAG: VanZ family protein [Verrucomicrobiota bacterium]|nr:VanZ family protein [Verrucomicrobiota bacterium]